MQKTAMLANLPCKLSQIRNVSSAMTNITKVHRLLYCRFYPTMLVQPDGSTITVRYHEPRQIIQVNIYRRLTEAMYLIERMVPLCGAIKYVTSFSVAI